MVETAILFMWRSLYAQVGGDQYAMIREGSQGAMEGTQDCYATMLAVNYFWQYRERLQPMGMHEEYKSLRSEIAQRQQARLYILAFTVAAIGTILGSILAEHPISEGAIDTYSWALTNFAIGLLIVAQLITIQYTQQIRRIGGFIREFIEGEDGDIQWQTKWKGLREKHKIISSSKPIAGYYGFLTISLCFIYFMPFEGTKLYLDWHALVVGVLGLISIFCSLNLYFRWTRGWKDEWTSVAPASGPFGKLWECLRAFWKKLWL